MSITSKIAIVVAGYVAALLLGFAAGAVNSATTNAADRVASSGMSAFGDSLLFLAVFAVAAVPATGAAIFFLKDHRWFWRGLSLAALAIAVIVAAGLALLLFGSAG